MKETVSSLRNERSLLLDVASVLLGIFVVWSLFSIIGWSQNVTSILSYPTNRIIDAAVITISILGIYGLLGGSTVGFYFALLASILEVILSIFSIMKAQGLSQLGLTQMFQTGVAIVISVLTCLCLMRTNGNRLKLAKTTPAPSYSTSANEYAIQIIDVTKKYVLGPTTVMAVNGLNVNIRKGEALAIMGPSGSGKSTLLNLIGTLDRPTSGNILIDGVDISTLDDAGLAKLRNEKIGFVFQSYNLIDRSKVIRNMELPALVKGYTREERFEKIHSVLKMVGLDNKVDRKPRAMSGGEQQRVAIARALVNDPKIVLADEPTGNLDSKTGREIVGFLKKMNIEKGTTLIIVTHSREVAEMADRIIHFRDGMIVNEEILRSKIE